VKKEARAREAGRSMTIPEQRRRTESWISWAIVALVVVVIVAALALGAEQMGNRAQPVEAEVRMTPIVGGMALPAANAAALTPETDAVVDTTAEPQVEVAPSEGAMSENLEAEPGGAAGVTPETESVVDAEGATAVDSVPSVEATAEEVRLVLVPGQVVTGREGSVRLYADATTSAPFLDSYGRATTFTVLEPSGEYDQYPVQQDERTWVRVRAADGLVGWAATDTLAPAQ
jgi:hypothetical protein